MIIVMTDYNINPFGSSAVMPEGYPIADNLNTNSAQQALSAKQGKKLGDELYTLKILCIGNSFSRDSLSYVPIILNRLNIDVEIGILYHAGCSMQNHWENRTTANYYIFDHYTKSAGKWSSSATGTNYNKTLADGLNAAAWDVVVFQQNSLNSTTYSTYQPYLNNLIDYIVGTLPNVKIWWNLTHAYAVGYSGISSMTDSDNMADAVKVNAKKVLEETAVQMVLPYGVAVQLARHDSTLDNISGLNDLCQSDYLHLHDGIGCQVAAYANAEAILRYLGIKKSVMGDTLSVDSTFLTTYAIPEPTKSGDNPIAIGSNSTNRLLAQKYAIMANNEFNI